MAFGTGLGGQIGVAAETTYGTFVPPTRFHEFDKETLKKEKGTFQGGGIAAGRLADLASRRVLSTASGSGGFTSDVTYTGMGLLVAHLMGSSAAPVQQGATTAYLQTHDLGDNLGKYLSVQKGVPTTNGTVNPYSFSGGKVTSATFQCDFGSVLTCDWQFDFQGVSEVPALASASYPATNNPFFGGQMAVKLGTYGAETSISGVTKIEVKIERSMATQRYYAQSAGSPATKLEPLTNDYVKVSGTLTTDFVAKADLADRFASDANTSLVIEWVGPTIASTYKNTFRIKVPAIFVDSDTPQIGGNDIVSTGFQFTGQVDASSHPLATIEYISTDTTI